MAHSPGPWIIENFSVKSANGKNVSGIVPKRMSSGDLRLVVSAPELLAALKAITPVTHFEGCEGLNFIRGCVEREEHCTCGAREARDAIAKVEGITEHKGA